MRLVFLGLSLSSSWGNGHATTYRALLAALARRGHSITFLEREQPWYAAHRDLRNPNYCELVFYESPDDLHRFAPLLRDSDAVVVGSYVPESLRVMDVVRSVVAPRVLAGEGRASSVMAGDGRPYKYSTVTPPPRLGWPAFAGQDTGGYGVGGPDPRPLLCFYDIDTPITLRKLAAGDTEYLSAAMVPRFDLYLSFTGGPMLRVLEEAYGARMARALYCSADPAQYHPVDTPKRWALGYLGTYSADRQPPLDRLLLEPARRLPHLRFVVAGSLYPADIAWPSNVDRIDHLPPAEHAAFYASLDWALNVTRADMIRAGYSPSVRLFEATACGTPVISDDWPGLCTLFEPDRELLIAPDTESVMRALTMAEAQRLEIGHAGRQRTLRQHTAERRARELETYLRQAGVSAAVEQGAEA
jgi:spore maturation protein CgeB